MRVSLLHWDIGEGRMHAERLEAAGYQVEVSRSGGSEVLRRLRKHPPDAVIIDLSRMPSYGRDIAAGIRLGKSTRNVPIIFAGGEQGKVLKIKQFLPDAAYLRWDDIPGQLEGEIENPPSDPVVPESILAGYSGTPLPKKLGINPNSRLVLIGAPSDFEQTMGKLPEGVGVTEDQDEPADLIIFFVKFRKELVGRLQELKDMMAEKGGLWIAWPKKSSGVFSDLTQAEVRSLGLSRGLVDYKVCAIDSTWSGLKFARRR